MVGMATHKSVRLRPDTHELVRDLATNLEVTMDVAIRRAVIAYEARLGTLILKEALD
jgi:predicted transcriptional regulator